MYVHISTFLFQITTLTCVVVFDFPFLDSLDQEKALAVDQEWKEGDVSLWSSGWLPLSSYIPL